MCVVSSVVVGKEDRNFSALSPEQAEAIVRNLTSEYAGFVNHRLITEGCYYEYINSRNDPGADNDHLKEGLLNVITNFNR